MASRPQPLLSPSPPLLQQQPLLLTIRFSTSLPDLHLDIPSPSTTTVASLRHLIRSRLDPSASSRRLRFIHQGRILAPLAALSSVLRAPPPRASSSSSTPVLDPKGKGKAIEGQTPLPDRIYVNCSIGDVLSAEELATETSDAALPPSTSSSPPLGGTPLSTAQTDALSRGTTQSQYQTRQNGPAEQRTPRGFDRLLTAGFTAAEINQLRLQFTSIQESRHTPDTMPSPDTLRTMEDTWIDTNAGDTVTGHGGGTETDFADDPFGVMSGTIDTLLQGIITGFFWPLATLCWLVREEGMWSKRRQVAVIFGLFLSLSIGIFKAIAGDGE